MRILLRVRGILFTMLAWGAVWALAGRAFYPAWHAWREWANLGTACYSFFGGHPWGGWGAASGLAFALLLLGRERGGGVDALRMARFTAFGALGGAAIPLLNLGMSFTRHGSSTTDLDLALLIGAVLGGGCAAGALAIARRGPRSIVR